VRRPARREHADDVAVLKRRLGHDGADRVRVAEVNVDVVGDRFELVRLGARIEAEVHRRILVAVDLRHLAVLRLDEGFLDGVIPAN
jgi:hypothetical protein